MDESNFTKQGISNSTISIIYLIYIFFKNRTRKLRYFKKVGQTINLLISPMNKELNTKY